MKRKNSAPPERGVENQTITVGGLGTAGGDYKTRVRATTHEGIHSPWTDEVTFTLTDATEGTATDPNLPDTVTNVEIRGMLNAIYVEFDDEFFATDNPLMSHNMGSYEIEVSNVSNAFPDGATGGNVWTTTLGDDDDAGPPNGPTRKFKVPTGDGFICTGMKSTGSGGLEHFVRVRGINSNGSTSSAYSTVESVTLDTDDVSQTAVVIGQDAIYATHVKAGTLTAEELQAGTITATEISSGQIFASEIRLPAANPGTGGDASEFHATRAFTIDQDGNMWWGNYANIGAAQGARTSWIDSTGDSTFLGVIASDSGGTDGNLFALGNLGNARIVIGDNTTNLGLGGTSGGYGYLMGFTGHADEGIPGYAVFTYEDEGNHRYGAAYLVAPRFHGGSTNGVDDYLGASNDRFKYAGVRLRDPKISHHVHEGTVPNNNSTANTIRLAATASGTNDIYNDHTIHITGGTGSGQSRTITDYVVSGSTKTATVSPAWDTNPASGSTYTMSGFGEALLVHPADMDYMGLVSGPRSEGGSAYGTAYSEVMGVVTAPGGLRITGHNVAPGTPGGLTLDSGTPATGSTNVTTSRNKLWNDGGTIMWGATDLTAGGSGSTNFLPTSQSGSNLASVSVSGDDVTISASKTLTTTSDTGRKGLVISSAASASTGVSLELNGLDLTTPSSGGSHYSVWSQAASGVNKQFKVSFNNLATFMADLAGFTSKYLTISNASSTYMTASTIASTYLTSAAASVTYAPVSHAHSYLPLSAGSSSPLTGNLYMPAYGYINFGNSGYIATKTGSNYYINLKCYSNGATQLHYANGSNNNTTRRLNAGNSSITVYKDLLPNPDASYQSGTWYGAVCGSAGSTWVDVYSETVTEVSDVNKKTDIQDATFGLDFVKGLRPITYKWKQTAGRAGVRDHHGFIAQEVQALLGDDAASMGIWNDGHIPASTAETEDDVDIEESWVMSLRYNQFIPILTKALQELEARVAALEG
jgi:hypothetical protein